MFGRTHVGRKLELDSEQLLHDKCTLWKVAVCVYDLAVFLPLIFTILNNDLPLLFKVRKADNDIFSVYLDLIHVFRTGCSPDLSYGKQ